MLRRESRSAIINISSEAVDMQASGAGVFSGTKAFNHKLTEIVAQENDGKIDFLSFKAPFMISESELYYSKNISNDMQLVRVSAKSIINDLGSQLTSRVDGLYYFQNFIKLLLSLFLKPWMRGDN